MQLNGGRPNFFEMCRRLNNHRFARQGIERCIITGRALTGDFFCPAEFLFFQQTIEQFIVSADNFIPRNIISPDSVKVV